MECKVSQGDPGLCLLSLWKILFLTVQRLVRKLWFNFSLPKFSVFASISSLAMPGGKVQEWQVTLSLIEPGTCRTALFDKVFEYIQ